ncbi:hypothetical protein [Pseudoalteromonas sp. OANN1]|uniref:hypothetical protein n=1 Tax=Pseudoalteromonas sp. OANN1 TaxID=2954497 RepID=UPI00209729A0|nr:hypothetical protein [Pseudoalteromonas sp. OANN1]MCO7201327.1 hypothetical protein [Pseudoalteromonas sp. OANN1]
MPSITTDMGSLPIDKYADTCPHCHHAVSPRFVNATLSGDQYARGTYIDVAFKCTLHDCSRLFIGIYQRTTVQGDKMVKDFKFQKSVPLNFRPPEIQQEVKDISPSFEAIYSQANSAESSGLDEIAGVGYRKALEFLIKDYCIHKNPDETDSIKSSFLGVVIDKFVDDTNLKACAKRAAWLGNDETHYVRKWENKDISDLKVLIKLSCGWVSNNILTEKYMAEMA